MKYDEISELSPVMKAFLGVFQCTSGIFRDNPKIEARGDQFLSHQLMEDDFSEGKNPFGVPAIFQRALSTVTRI